MKDPFDKSDLRWHYRGLSAVIVGLLLLALPPVGYLLWIHRDPTINRTGSFFHTWVVWVIVFFCVACFALMLRLYIVYVRRNNRMREEFDEKFRGLETYVHEQMEYQNKQFHNHFEVTDATIKDLRNQRDELKERLKKLK